MHSRVLRASSIFGIVAKQPRLELELTPANWPTFLFGRHVCTLSLSQQTAPFRFIQTITAVIFIFAFGTALRTYFHTCPCFRFHQAEEIGQVCAWSSITVQYDRWSESSHTVYLLETTSSVSTLSSLTSRIFAQLFQLFHPGSGTSPHAWYRRKP